MKLKFDDQQIADLLQSHLVWLVNKPDELVVKPERSGVELKLRIDCAPQDVGFLIGKGGYHARALRTLFDAIGVKYQRKIELILPDYFPQKGTKL